MKAAVECLRPCLLFRVSVPLLAVSLLVSTMVHVSSVGRGQQPCAVVVGGPHNAAATVPDTTTNDVPGDVPSDVVPSADGPVGARPDDTDEIPSDAAPSADDTVGESPAADGQSDVDSSAGDAVGASPSADEGRPDAAPSPNADDGAGATAVEGQSDVDPSRPAADDGQPPLDAPAISAQAVPRNAEFAQLNDKREKCMRCADVTYSCTPLRVRCFCPALFSFSVRSVTITSVETKHPRCRAPNSPHQKSVRSVSVTPVESKHPFVEWSAEFAPLDDKREKCMRCTDVTYACLLLCVRCPALFSFPFSVKRTRSAVAITSAESKPSSLFTLTPIFDVTSVVSIAEFAQLSGNGEKRMRSVPCVRCRLCFLCFFCFF